MTEAKLCPKCTATLIHKKGSGLMCRNGCDIRGFLVRTPTGRLVNPSPVIQNLPIRTPEGFQIRQAFIHKE